ncbi:unnamed protein product [Urochloa humidicola]
MAPADAFAKRKKSLRKMAWELSMLCGVDVALAVVEDGGDVPAVWESREGVLARYRALHPEVRARHAHRAYLEAELGKKEDKLARVRQDGAAGLRVRDDDAALDHLLDGAAAATAADARQLLDVIDAAIRAADARRAALGMPADGAVLEGIAPVGSAAGVGDYYLLPPHHGNAGEEQAIWGNDGGGLFHPCGAAAADMWPGDYGFQFHDGGGAGMDGYYYNLQMAAPAMYGDSSSSSHIADDAYPYQVPWHAQPNPDPAPMWSAAAADAPRHGMLPMPAEYTSADTGLSYYDYMLDTPAAATNASLQGNGAGGMSFTATRAASGNFAYDTPPALSLATASGNGICGGGNFISASPSLSVANATGGAGGNFAYATPAHPLAVSYYGVELTDAGWYAADWQPAAPQPIEQEQPHYLSDLEDTQLHLWGWGN